MYAEAGLLFPYLQGFSLPQELHHHHHHLLQFQEGLLCGLHSGNSCFLPDNARTSTVSEYDLGGEGDLFKAPEPIIEEPVIELDPMTAAISIMSSGENVITAEAIKVADMDSIQNEQLLSEVFYECKKDLLAKSAIEDSFLASSDIKIPALLQIEEDQMIQNDKSVAEGPIQKSVSSGCLTSTEWIGGGAMRPTFLDFKGMDFEVAFGMRRSYSEGDIQTLGNGNTGLINASTIHPPLKQLLTIGDKIEERKQKLSRYRKKKTKRNFGRKIKYACRKVLADSQPRVRGRFAKTEEREIAKPAK